MTFSSFATLVATYESCAIINWNKKYKNIFTKRISKHQLEIVNIYIYSKIVYLLNFTIIFLTSPL